MEFFFLFFHFGFRIPTQPLVFFFFFFLFFLFYFVFFFSLFFFLFFFRGVGEEMWRRTKSDRYRWVEIVSRSECGREKGNMREEICVNIYIHFRLIGKCDICAQIQFKSLVGEKNKRVYICIIPSPTRSFHPHKLFLVLRYHPLYFGWGFYFHSHIGSVNVRRGFSSRNYLSKEKGSRCG